MRKVDQIKIMIGTSEDVDSINIHNEIKSVVNDWNIINDYERNIVLYPQHWKTNVHPGIGKAQARIDKGIVDDSDGLIACMWTTCGEGLKGEIKKFSDKGKPVMVYFYEPEIIPTRLMRCANLNAVQEYKQDIRDILFYDDNGITNVSQLKTHITSHLNGFVRDIINKTDADKLEYISESLKINDSEEFRVIDHANSFYKDDHNDKNLIIKNSNKSFFWSIPEKYREALINKGFIKDNYNTNYSSRQNQQHILERLTNFLTTYYGLENNQIKDLFNEVSKQTVEFFLDKTGTKSFNGSVLGLYNVSRNRTISPELPTIDLQLYESDYFTFNFMNNLYKKLNEINSLKFTINSIDDVNTLVPFLNSVGIGGFICFDRGYGLEILFARRGPNVACPNHIHFTFDETFSLTDQIELSGIYEYDHVRCLKRALKEEVVGRDNEFDKRVEYGFTDVAVIKTKTRLELELCAYAYIQFDEKYSFEQFSKKYKIAPDANWETSEMIPVRIDDVDSFLEGQALVTPECKVYISRLLERIKAGYLTNIWL